MKERKFQHFQGFSAIIIKAWIRVRNYVIRIADGIPDSLLDVRFKYPVINTSAIQSPVQIHGQSIRDQPHTLFRLVIHFNVVREHQGHVAGSNHAQVLRYVFLSGVPAPHRVPCYHVEEHDAISIDRGPRRVTVVLGSGSTNGHELLRISIRGPLVPEDRRGHGELSEAGHRVEEQRPVVADVHGTERDPEYPVSPQELYAMQIVPGRQGIGIEEGMLDSESAVLEEIVHHDAVAPYVAQVSHCRAAVVLPDVHRDVDVQGVLFDLLVRQSVLSDEIVSAQIEDEYGRRAHLLRPYGELRFAGIEDPQSIAFVHLESEDRC